MIKTSHIHYVILAGIFGFGSIAFILFRGNPFAQFITGVLLSISYIIWGWVHHYHHKSLHKKVVVEYLLIGCIAIVLLAMVLRP